MDLHPLLEHRFWGAWTIIQSLVKKLESFDYGALGFINDNYFGLPQQIVAGKFSVSRFNFGQTFILRHRQTFSRNPIIF